MAYKKPGDAPTTRKRRVKNPQTFRERAEKANVVKDKPKKDHKILSAPWRLIKAISRPIVRLNRRLRKVKFLKPVYAVLHFIGLILWPRYIRSSIDELKLVTWPKFKLSLRLTWAVIAFAIVFGCSIALLDFGLDKVFKSVLLK
ncbi:MAG TPA: preprotein translocase subunit SecE [Candidatus Saccharimonadales bacterium]